MPAWLMISCCCLAQAASPPPVGMPQRVAGLVRQLDDDRWERRAAAEQALLELGPDALDALPESVDGFSPEARERIRRVRNQLQVTYANRAVEASRVTLQGTMSLQEALERISRQTANPIASYSEVGQRSVSVHLQQAPFWEAMDQVLDQARLTIDPYGGPADTLHLVEQEPGQTERQRMAYYEGVFRIAPTHISTARDLLHPSIAGLRIRLSMTWEPRAKPISVTLPLAEVYAQDDRGAQLHVDGDGGRLNVPVESSVPIVELEVPLELPSRDAQVIRVLRGAFEVMVPGPLETFTFTALDGGTEQQWRQRRAGVQVALLGIRPNDDVTEFNVQVAFDDASNALESHRGWILKNEAYLVDAQGKRIEHGGRRLTGQDRDSIQMRFMFALDQPLSSYQFVYRTPSLIIRQPMHFELKDIALP